MRATIVVPGVKFPRRTRSKSAYIIFASAAEVEVALESPGARPCTEGGRLEVDDLLLEVRRAPQDWDADN